MKNMKKVLCLALCALMILSMAACGSKAPEAAPSAPAADAAAPAAPAAPAEKEKAQEIWKISAMGSDTYHVTLGWYKFEELIEAKLDYVDVQVFPNGQLGTSADQCIGGMQNNIIQFSDISVGNVAEYTNAFLPLDAPFLFSDRETAFAVVDGEAGKLMAAKYEEDTDIVLLGLFDYGFRHVTNSKHAIEGLADFEGLKIRTLGSPTYLDMISALGANPSTMAYAEVFTGLQQGTIDGQENPLSSIVDAKFFEVNPYIALTGHLYGFLGFHCGGDWFYGHTEEEQQIIRDCAAEALAYQRELCDEANNQALQTLKDAGCTITEYDEATKEDFRNATASVWDSISETVGADYFNAIVDATK